ncbi:MAG TPA: 3-hydroxyacyl-CoA dehydrogenase NAD-binding domain-containing protein [Solirubrobacteraceae bacterium]|nr:3-hydroxyacyl-CoA dehydrogenase NAD-binding domain-containing protein [Solirubrobacteraceae bacterium]
MAVPDVIGVCGAGTMGAGIAQLAAEAGARTLLFDAAEGAAARALERLDALVARGKVAPEARARIEPAAALEDLAPCGLVIEAVPERLALKQELFARLEAVVGAGCVLATNTSSLPVTEIAAGAERPERVVGMHFFNPAPLMALVEVVAGARSGAAALATARAVGAAMGRRVIDAADTPGFLVNRCNRPFGLEALRLVQERLATPAQVDRIARLAGGFRMGPFELMDLVGLDVSLAVQRSFFEQSFGEPRWRPSPLLARQVAAGRLGRKTGCGWYEYAGGAPHRPPDPDPPEAGGGDGLVVIAGESPLALELAGAAAEAGWEVAAPAEAEGELPALIVDCGATDEDPPLQGAPQLLLCDLAPLATLDPGGSSAGFHALAPLAATHLVELTRQPTTSAAAAAAAERFFATLGRHVEWVGDAPGLVLGRIVAQLVNEACFAVGEGAGAPADVDAGMVLGLSHPRGPLEWGDAIGPAQVLATLEALHREYLEERYRPAPLLVRAARADAPLRSDS